MSHIPDKHADIYVVTDEIIRLQEVVAANVVETPVTHDWKKELSLFAAHYGPFVINLLDELRSLREKSGTDGLGFRHGFRTVLEGYSDISAADAMSQALVKASGLFSEHHDISVTLQGLISLPEGGHRAVVEVHISPLTLRHHPHVQGPDVELKRIHDHEYDQNKKYEEEHLQHLVFDHVVSTTGGCPPEVPNYFLININDAYLLNHLIEKEFVRASHSSVSASFDDPAPVPRQILVRTKRKGLHPAPEPD